MKEIFYFGGMILGILDLAVILLGNDTKISYILNIVMGCVTMLGSLLFGLIFDDQILWVLVISFVAFDWTVIYLTELNSYLKYDEKRKKIVFHHK